MKKTLIIILGPTAIGKTALAIAVAKKFDAEIISADSRQFYKELNIGVAKPTTDELNAIKHHFIGNLSLSDYYNVSRFENEVISFLKGYFQAHSFAVMVGGSGLYINAVCSGIDDLPDPDKKLREELKVAFEKEGIEPLTKQLKKLDPEYYNTLEQLEEQYDLLLMKIAIYLQDNDLALHNHLCNAWLVIWEDLRDFDRFHQHHG